MTPFVERLGRFTISYYSSHVEPRALLGAISRAELVGGKGRGGIKIFEAGGLRLVSRKYMHGGLLRAFTRDLFLRPARATKEAEIMAYVREKGLPAAAPFCAIEERLFPVCRIYLVTYLQEGAVELLDHLRQSTRRERLRCSRRLAELMWLMKESGVFHPDFHLKNVLVTPGKRLVFLDFDRSRRRTVSDRDMKSMFRRLARFADKMVLQGRLDGSDEEKALFVRTYARLSGTDPDGWMRGGGRRTYLNRLGWLVESLLYGRRS